MTNLLDRLPVASAYRQAVLDDPEVAEELAARPDRDGPPASPALAEWTPEVAALTHLGDLLLLLHSDLVALAGHKPPQVKPQLRPRTGVDVARARKERQEHDSLVAEVYAAMDRWQETYRD